MPYLDISRPIPEHQPYPGYPHYFEHLGAVVLADASIYRSPDERQYNQPAFYSHRPQERERRSVWYPTPKPRSAQSIEQEILALELERARMRDKRPARSREIRVNGRRRGSNTDYNSKPRRSSPRATYSMSSANDFGSYRTGGSTEGTHNVMKGNQPVDVNYLDDTRPSRPAEPPSLKSPPLLPKPSLTAPSTMTVQMRCLSTSPTRMEMGEKPKRRLS